MKYFKIIILTLAVVAGTSCTLDLRENPNAVQPGQELPSLVLNTLQLNLAGMFQAASTIGMQQTRLQNGAGTDYSNSVRPETFNGIWSTAYAGILVEANSLIASADALGYARHAGIARIISAYTLVLLVDFFGDVPYSQAFQGSGNFNPALDDQEDVYAEAVALLTQAKDDLTTPLTSAGGRQNPVAPTITDMYYGATTPTSSYANWVRLANTLLVKIYLNTGQVPELNAAISAAGGLITAQNQNFIFRYSTNASAPDSRHPRFVANYPAGGGNYMSNWLMWHMFHGYDATHRGGDPGDPRIRFYFYRQRLVNSTDANELRCLTESIPSHYPSSTGTSIIDNSVAGRPPLGVGAGHPTVDPADPAWTRTFCVPTDRGYWGRDHQDNQGIPPDNFARTAWGAYPAGGRFDNNTGAAVSASVGMRGAGFQPIMMRSFVEFMLAEANLRLGATTPQTARQHFENGIRYSMTDVRDWAVNGTYGTTSVTASPTEATTINDFYPAAFNRTVRVATTGNISTLSGLLTIDGVTLSAGDRVLVKNQSSPSQNGIYVASSAAWSRATDSDESSEIVGQVVRVTEGTTNANTYWRQTTTGTISIGSTAINYVITGIYPVDVDRYVAAALAAFDDTSPGANPLNYVAREYWIALFGNGIEAYNLYRRTGLPTGMQPALNPAPGPFPRLFWYPANVANLNRNIQQRTSMTDRVFWDTSGANLDF